MHFTSFLEEGRLTVALTGEIDHHCAKAYIQAIAAKIEACWIFRRFPLWIPPALPWSSTP